jgi:anion-transporting  ArsA/GET3 family ATPase
MILDQLLSKRLVFLSGKGGVGKSTIGLALALAACARGRRVLLVEIDAALEAGRMLDRPPVGSVETALRPGLFALNLEPATAMDEYVHRTLKIGLLARRITSSPIYRRFFAAAPGLRELMVLGKLMDLAEKRKKGRTFYDLVLVDAPATGHGLAMLKVPLAAAAAIPVGPIGRHARRIAERLRDPAHTALAICALPEEMASVEAIELHQMASEDVHIETVALFLNQCHERRLTREQEGEVLRLSASGASGTLAGGIPLREALITARRHVRRRKMTRFYRNRLRRACDVPLVSLPFVFDDPFGETALMRLAAQLEKQ